MSRLPLPPAALRVFWYARDSGGADQQASVAQQLAEYERVSAEQGWRCAGVFTDVARSGASDKKRKGLKHLVAAAQPGAADAVLFWSSARLARDVVDAPYYRSLLRKRGYQLIYLADPLPDAGDMTPVLESVRDVADAAHARKASIEAKRGHSSTIAQGYVCSKPPRCYKLETVQNGVNRLGHPKFNSHFVPDPGLRERGRLAWQMRAQGYSLKAIHRRCRLFKNLPSYTHFFANEIYRGVYCFGGRRVENFCEPLCTEAEWRAVQEIRKNGRPPRSVSSPYLLTGLVYCARCGGRMSGKRIFSRRFRKPFDFRYYRCDHHRFDTDPEERTCTAPMIRKEKLEQAIVNALVERLLTPPYLRELWEIANKPDWDEGLVERARDELAEIESALTHLLNLAEKGRAVEQRITEREAEREKKREVIAQLEATRPAARLPFATVEEIAERVKIGLRSGDVETARAALRVFVLEIEAEKGHPPRVHLTVPLSDYTAIAGGMVMG